MSRPALNEVSHENGTVVLTTRYWDGIDRPEHVTLEGLSPKQAIKWAERIMASAAEAELYAERMSMDNLEAKRTKLNQLRDEIAKIEREL